MLGSSLGRSLTLALQSGVFQGWGVASNSIPLNPPSKGGLPIRFPLFQGLILWGLISTDFSLLIEFSPLPRGS